MAFSAWKLAFLTNIFFSCTCPGLQGALLDDDHQSLLQIKLSLHSLLLSNNANSTVLSDWINDPNPINSSSSNPCSWSSVSCTSVANSTRVTGLDLSSLSIRGALSSLTAFSTLSSLFSLNLSHNSFTGGISQDIADCTHLLSLDLSYNNLSSLFQGASPLSSLQSLNLRANKISSPLSQAMPSNCSSLQSLDLSMNSFTGLSSVSWQDCPDLQTLDLSYNLFTDSNLPINLTSLPSLHHFAISSSYLLGRIPSSICLRSASLQHLDLSNNYFSGGFPLFLTNCSSLHHLDISGNNLAGELSSKVGDFISLEMLDLSANFLNGTLPAELGNLTTLQVFMASSNAFVGSIPKGLSNCKNLSILRLNTNSLGGNLSDFFFNASALFKFLDLSSNGISGSISPHFLNMTSLQFLLLADNHLSSEIPPELGDLSDLVFLDVSSNKLQGHIPSSLGQLQNLLWLMLAHNNLSGSIPPQVGNCTSLLWLNLKSNALTGELPSEMATMGQHLQRTFTTSTMNPILMGLRDCLLLKRWVPENFPPYSFLIDILDVSRCKSLWINLLTASPSNSVCAGFPDSGGYIQISDNKITGSVLSSFQNNQISMLLQSRNLFTGNLPDHLGILLLHLNLSRNLLSDPIPSTFADNAWCLGLLDLSYNNLSGLLPSSLGNLTQLSSFNVSYNPWLSGSIPDSAQFLTFGLNSYMGDPLLCYNGRAGMREVESSNTSTLPICASMSLAPNPTSTQADDSQTPTATDKILQSKPLLALAIVASFAVGFCLTACLVRKIEVSFGCKSRVPLSY